MLSSCGVIASVALSSLWRPLRRHPHSSTAPSCGTIPLRTGAGGFFCLPAAKSAQNEPSMHLGAASTRNFRSFRRKISANRGSKRAAAPMRGGFYCLPAAKTVQVVCLMIQLSRPKGVFCNFTVNNSKIRVFADVILALRLLSVSFGGVYRPCASYLEYRPAFGTF